MERPPGAFGIAPFRCVHIEMIVSKSWHSLYRFESNQTATQCLVHKTVNHRVVDLIQERNKGFGFCHEAMSPRDLDSIMKPCHPACIQRSKLHFDHRNLTFSTYFENIFTCNFFLWKYFYFGLFLNECSRSLDTFSTQKLCLTPSELGDRAFLKSCIRIRIRRRERVN